MAVAEWWEDYAQAQLDTRKPSQEAARLLIGKTIESIDVNRFDQMKISFTDGTMAFVETNTEEEAGELYSVYFLRADLR